MPLTLILGRVGCGKTAYMADEIARRLDGGEPAVTLLVPDQYTVASENYFLSRIGEKRFRRLNVTSLKSLARTQFLQHGIPTRFLGEGGKTVLLKKAFDAVSPQLKYYPPEYRNPKFIPLLLGAIKELKAAGISAEELMDTARRENNDKLYDLAMIRQVYEGYLSEGFFDPDDAPARLRKLLEETGDFEDESVYVANFRTFYNRERNILLQMVKNGARVTVALPTDSTDPNTAGPTADSAEEARKLAAYCRQMGEECRIVDLQKNASFSSEEFALLERELTHPSGKYWEENPEHLHLFCGADRFDEAEQAAAIIAQKVRDEGYRYGDFTVIVRSLEDYAGILDPVFDQYEIPLFYHRKTPLRQRNPVPLITALFSLASEGLNRDAALAFVKSGFCGSPEQASCFERYVNTWSVNYNRFRLPFTRPIGGFTDGGAESEEDRELRLQADEVRRRMVETADRLKDGNGTRTVEQFSRILYGILEDLQVPQILDRNAEEYREYGEYELAARQKKVYEQLMLALDEMVLTAGADEVSLAEYRDLFFSVIDTHDVAILPTSLDEVTAGSPETLPMISPRCVFVLGLNEGIFPRNIDDNRLLTDEDREQLSPFGIGETTDDKILHELFYLYLSFTAPREDLYLSYAAVLGSEAAPSSYFERITELFPKAAVERLRTGDPDSLSLRIQRERASFALHTKTPVAELEPYFAASPEYAPVLEKREQQTALSRETAEKIYPENLYISASRADKYHQCQYAYFCQYGLKIFPRRKADLNAAQRGTVVHAALESIIAQGLDCTDEELHQRVQAFGREQLNKLYGDEEIPSSMQNYFQVLLTRIERLLTLFRKEFEHSEFVPAAFEQPVGKGGVDPVVIPLEEGTLSMIGIVDRVDVYERDGVKYLRVVDYKTGEKKFSFEKIQNGIDIQMLMYLYALQQNLYPGQTCLPAGVQYVGSNPATVTAQRNQPEAVISLSWEDKTPRSGVYLKDNGVLHAMDATEERKFLRIKDNSSKFLITLEQFGTLFGQISRCLAEMGNELHRGKIAKNPLKIGREYESCRFCDLRFTCRHPEPRDVFAPEGKETAHAQVD